jgi:hypothetical protein
MASQRPTRRIDDCLLDRADFAAWIAAIQGRTESAAER